MIYLAFGKLDAEGWTDRSTAEHYAASFARATDIAIAPIISASGAGPGTRVLDLCCGHGAGTEALLAAGADVIGLDFSPAMSRQTRSRAQATDLREGDARSMPFSDATFDAVVWGFGIMHIPDQPKVLSEVHRVLRPGTARRGEAMLLALPMKLWDDRSQLPAPEKSAMTDARLFCANAVARPEPMTFEKRCSPGISRPIAHITSTLRPASRSMRG